MGSFLCAVVGICPYLVGYTPGGLGVGVGQKWDVGEERCHLSIHIVGMVGCPAIIAPGQSIISFHDSGAGQSTDDTSTVEYQQSLCVIVIPIGGIIVFVIMCLIIHISIVT